MQYICKFFTKEDVMEFCNEMDRKMQVLKILPKNAKNRILSK